MFMVMDSHLKETIKEKVPKTNNRQILCNTRGALRQSRPNHASMHSFEARRKKYTNIWTYN